MSKRALKVTFAAIASTAASGLILLVVSALPAGAESPSQTSAPRLVRSAAVTVTPITSWAQIQLPADLYQQQVADRNLVLDAEYQLTAACMAAQGFKFDAPKWSSDSAASGHYRLFGLIDSNHAATLGYHNESELAGQADEQEPEPSGYLQAFMGTGKMSSAGQTDDGCIGKARSTLKDDGALAALLEGMQGDALDAADADPLVQDAFAKWSVCMASAGFKYATPMEANNDSRWASNVVTSMEKKVAVADVRCKLATNLSGVRTAVAGAYEQTLIQKEQGPLNDAIASAARSVQIARGILTSR